MPLRSARQQRLGERPQKLSAALKGLCFIVALGAGCAPTRYYQREKLADRAMQFDADRRLAYIRTKMEAAREGSLGGYGNAVAGGCGCQ